MLQLNKPSLRYRVRAESVKAAAMIVMTAFLQLLIIWTSVSDPLLRTVSVLLTWMIALFAIGVPFYIWQITHSESDQ